MTVLKSLMTEDCWVYTIQDLQKLFDKVLHERLITMAMQSYEMEDLNL